MELTEVVGTSRQEIKHALEGEFSDFEDGIQYATALQVEGINAIITRNVSDYRHSKIAVFTPDDFLKMWEGQ